MPVKAIQIRLLADIPSRGRKFAAGAVVRLHPTDAGRLVAEGLAVQVLEATPAPDVPENAEPATSPKRRRAKPQPSDEDAT